MTTIIETGTKKPFVTVIQKSTKYFINFVKLIKIDAFKMWLNLKLQRLNRYRLTAQSGNKRLLKRSTFGEVTDKSMVTIKKIIMANGPAVSEILQSV